jgi:hypothetical protein
MQFLPGLVDARTVVAVDDEDESLRAGEVVPPQRADLVLPADVPDVEFHVLVGDGLDVEAYGRDGGDVLVELELVEDCCGSCVLVGLLAGLLRDTSEGEGDVTGLACGVEAQHEQAHFARAEDLAHHF